MNNLPMKAKHCPVTGAIPAAQWRAAFLFPSPHGHFQRGFIMLLSVQDAAATHAS
jgi:hypothetical protein